MIIGIDLHGVITRDPEIFSKLTRKLIENNHEVHIITGVAFGARLNDELIKAKVSFNQLFSITSKHKDLGTPMIYKNGDIDQPLIDNYLWNSAKAIYCNTYGIDFHIDDSLVYGNYFEGIKTKYLLYNDNMRELFKMFISIGNINNTRSNNR